MNQTSSAANPDSRGVNASPGGGAKEMPRTSIVGRFNRALTLLYLGVLAVSLIGTFFLTRQQVLSQAEGELALLEDMIESLRLFVRDETRDYFLAQNVFFAPVTVEALAPKLLADKFLQAQPDYYIRLVSDNPLNPANRAEPFELALLQEFRDNPGMGRRVETGTLRGRPYLLASNPLESVPSCFQCHGLYSSVPVEVSGDYEPWSGVNFRGDVGSVVGLSMVGVPMENLNALVVERSAVLVVVLTLLFAGHFLAVNVIVKRSIVRPIVDIVEKAREVSRGKIDQRVQSDRQDEIGNLYRSLELMRRSVELVLRHVRK